MNIGFHHHVPSVFDSPDRIRVPAFFGMFIEELARQAGTVTYYTYEGSDTGLEDHPLEAPGVRPVNLGPRPPAPVALLRPGRVLKRVDLERDGVDALLVRGPGPLLPGLVRHARRVPVAALIMGDYRSWRPGAVNPRWRNQLIRGYAAAYLGLQERALRNKLVLTNNPWLLRRRSGDTYEHGREVFTSSVSEPMLREIDASTTTKDGSALPRLLYTGRIVEEKGVVLIVEALGILRDAGVDAELELVGWAPDADPTPGRVRELADRLGLADRVTISDYVKAGASALVSKYLTADIYVFASPTEWGAPHTVQEAMAARVPVVMSSIEGLRALLRDGEHAVLVEPGSGRALAEGIRRVLADRDLREGIVTRGRLWAEAHTNERSVASILEHLEAWAYRSVDQSRLST
jgi:glycosyltransferase involved in cell wall biosynthesis